jgi:hypothetical protein
MTKIYSADPAPRRLIVSPNRDEALIVRKRAVRMPVFQEPDWNRNAPIREFSERFKQAMRAKGWLR